MATSLLNDRAILHITGEDAAAFLQGLITNDIRRATQERAVYAVLLSPQGKYLHDFFLLGYESGYLLETEKSRLDELTERLRRYRLRSKVEWQVQPGWQVAAWFETSAPGLPTTPGEIICTDDAFLFADPRHASLGGRITGPQASVEKIQAAHGPALSETAYHRMRLQIGVPDSSRDMKPERALMLEYGIDQLHGIDFTKGCYVGQEVTARSKHRATLRKYLHQVTSSGGEPLPPADTPITYQGKDIGEMRSAQGSQGLAILRWEEVADAAKTSIPIMAGDIALQAAIPSWLTVDLTPDSVAG